MMLKIAEATQDERVAGGVACPGGGVTGKTMTDEVGMKCAGGPLNNKRRTEKITLRFRPIAPKPATPGSTSGSVEDRASLITGKRPKRKHVRVRRNKKTRRSSAAREDLKKRRKEIDNNDSDNKSEQAVTLQLLPEKVQEHDGDPSFLCSNKSYETAIAETKDLATLGNHQYADHSEDPTVFGTADDTVIESWMTVESVTDGWTDGIPTDTLLAGCTDTEKIERLEVDACPAFVSDGRGRIRWINRAYRDMVAGEGGGTGIRVRLAVKDHNYWEQDCMRPVLSSSAGPFTCRVGIRWFEERRRKESRSMVVPCDAWRMDGGGFAWRLDVEAALRLGR